ncbi:MAG: SusF/SusE family outer membrane protein [Bacteroidaceae bacterium]|jgi:hypothetical protein|nr:SusF/SusE family outer membrane protein [Bacteroidaceae bacterium]
MKKIFYTLLLAAATMGLTTSCSEDRDSNPVLNTKGLSLVLNTPGVSYNNTIDLQYSQSIVLTTSQPNYGYPAPTTYAVYISLDNENFVALGTSYQDARMEIPADELNSALLDIVGDANVDKLADPVPVYMKAAAFLTGEGASGLGWVESNVITLPSVQAYVPVVELTLPTEMYIVGGFPASNGWSTFVPLHFAYSQDGFSYGIVYFNAGDEFKINPDAGWKGNDKGFGQVTIGDSNDAGVVNGGDSETSNMKATNAGWYTVIVKNKIVGNAISYELQTKTAKVYLFGATAPGDQWSFNDANLFTMSASATDPCVSPVMGGSGEVRLAVDCGIDWWKTEFTIKSDGTLYYRDCDIPSNWASDLGEEYSFQGAAGKQIYLDFTNGTGYQQ